MLASTPAVAAELPEGDTIYTAQWGAGFGLGDIEIRRVDPGPPTTLIPLAGTPVLGPEYIVDAAYDPTTGVAYVINAPLYQDICELWIVTLDPPAYTFVADIAVDGEATTFTDCVAFDILDDGTAYLMVDVNPYWGTTSLVTLDLATGFVSDFVATSFAEPCPYPFCGVTWIKYVEATSTMLALDFGGRLFELDLDTGVLTFVFETGTTGTQTPIDADIDCNGVIWFAGDRLHSFDPADPAGTYLEHDGPVAGWLDYGSDALWIERSDCGSTAGEGASGPQLADTGAAEMTVAGVGAALLLALGALMIGRRRTAS